MEMMDHAKIFTAKLQKLWNTLEPRLLVLLSLFLQIVLIAIGSRRKYRKNKWVAGILWLFYLSADAVATIALGVLSNAQADAENTVDPSYTIMAFWAPFLLMHLGGPDTITAYALADNELWGRHLLGLVGQVIIAVFVFLRSWTGTSINRLWGVIFLAGIFKYGERTWVLYSASKNGFRESMVSRPDPGPNYAKFMYEFVSKEHEGYEVSLVKAIDTSLNFAAEDDAYAPQAAGTQDQDVVLQRAYYFFGTFKKLFADLILSFQDRELSLLFFMSADMNWRKAFGIVEVELGLVYDLFYTKSPLLYSWPGFFLRLLSCSSTVTAFIIFIMIDKNVYPETELIITYVLLVGAIFLEIYAVMIILSSDRVMIWLTGDRTTLPTYIRMLKSLISMMRKIVLPLRYLHILPARMRWSNAMGQYNVLNCCIRGKQKCTKVCKYLEKHLCGKTKRVREDLKELIFIELKERARTDKKLGNYRGDKILLQEMNYFGEDDEDHEVEFDQSLLVWHMATDFCYFTDDDSSLDESVNSKREICKLLSNYMMHLLIMSPFMLPSGIGQIHFQDTCAEATEFFDNQKSDKKVACSKLCRVDTRLPPSKVKGDRSKSLLFDACRLAKSLRDLEIGQRWQKIVEAWLYLLTFAAAQCSWNDHAEKLSQGGELLTHVWLLMAHFGMTDQFQISQGYVRAKLQLA